MNNTVSYNFAMRHNTMANSMQIDRYQQSQTPSLPSSSSVQFSDAITSLNANPAELREIIDRDFQIDISEILDQFNNNDTDAYSLDNLITTLDSDNLDENFLNSNSDMSNNDF